MSVNLTSLVWEIEFPTATQKLLLLRVADYADDEGQGIYPSIKEVARQLGASERQVQYAIKALESVKMLERVEFGGTKEQRTNVWTLNVDLLAQLALQEMKLKGTHDCLEAVENTGAIIAPRTLARVQSRIQRVQSASQRGATDCTRVISNQNIEPNSAPERASDKPARAPVAKYRPVFDITPRDVQWREWFEWLGKRDPDLASAALLAGRMRTYDRWPNEKSALPTIDRGPAIEQRKLGETTA